MGKLPRFANDILTVYKDQLTEELRGLSDEIARDGLCRLASLNYKSEGKTQTVDYGERIARLVYLMRYFHSYSHEYLMMYRDIFRVMRPRPEVSVCSIGCGSLIDRWSAIRALGLKELSAWDRKTSVRYRGFDVQDWQQEADELWDGADDGFATIDWRGGAAAFAEALEDGACKPDIICFPKSAMEVRSDARAWEKVLGALGTLDGDEVWVAISRSQSYYRLPFYENGTYPGEIGDAMRAIVDELSAAVQAAGFNPPAEHLVDCAHHDEEDEIDREDMHRYRRATDKSALDEEYDEGLLKFMTSLHEFCPCWGEEGCLNPDIPESVWKEKRGSTWDRGRCRALDRNPAGVHADARSFRACYVILHFERG